MISLVERITSASINATLGLAGSMAMPREESRLVELFHHFFELVPATTEELKLEAYKLRYQVYCVETGFESAHDCPSLLDASGQPVYYEQDEFDHRSVHYLIRHRTSNQFVATTRMVLPDRQNPDALFPIEKHCGLWNKITDGHERRRLAESSRYAISKHLIDKALNAQMAIAGNSRMALKTELERMTRRHLSMGLVACLIHATRKYGIHDCYAVMEPALFRMMKRYGIHFTPIGPATEYHGLRIPGILRVDEMISSVKSTNDAVWELITNNGAFA